MKIEPLYAVSDNEYAVKVIESDNEEEVGKVGLCKLSKPGIPIPSNREPGTLIPDPGGKSATFYGIDLKSENIDYQDLSSEMPKSKAANRKYLEGWERTFGDKN